MMLFAYINILLGCVNLAFSFVYDDFISNYRAIARGTDAPEGSNMHVGRIMFNITVTVVHNPAQTSSLTIPNEGSGFFIKHIGPNGNEKLFFLTAAHIFDLNYTGIPTNYYINPGRTTKLSLLSKGTIEIFYGSVKIEDQKVFQVYPNGLYTTPTLGESHIVKLPSAYPFHGTSAHPKVDMIAIELTENQAHQFALDGGIFVTSKDDSPEKVFQAGEVCKIGSWGVTNVNETGPSVDATRLQQADMMSREKDYCTGSLRDDDPMKAILNNTKFACFSTHFSSDNDPLIRGGDSGAPITCGTETQFVATMVTGSDRFATVGPTRSSIFAFIKDCFYD